MNDHVIETEWLRGYARTYLPCDSVLVFCPQMLRDADVMLVDLIFLLRNARVVSSEKNDGPGAFWRIVGMDGDENPISAELEVNTQEISVEVVGVERLDNVQERSDDNAA